MKTLLEYINEGNAPLSNVLIGDVKRFNGCFADICTHLKKRGYGDITMFKEAKPSSYGLHRMHLEFQDNCKSDIEEVVKELEKHFGWKYDIWKADAKKDSKDYQYPSVWIMDKIH